VKLLLPCDILSYGAEAYGTRVTVYHFDEIKLSENIFFFFSN